MMSNQVQKSDKHSSVRLSAMNVDIRSKVAKFDTNNQGELTVEDMMHAIVTLQKQSNNYKRILYIVFPIMLIMILSIFGTTMLALSLTKELKTGNAGMLVNAKTNEVVSTGRAVNYFTFEEWMQSGNPDDLRNINALELKNMILPIQTVFVGQNSTTFVTEFMFINVDLTKNLIDIEVKKMYENDTYVKEIIDNIKGQMTNSKVAISNKMNGKWDIIDMLSYIFTISSTPQSLPSEESENASVKPTCAPNGICLPPKNSPKNSQNPTNSM
jgi:hypothetical protein